MAAMAGKNLIKLYELANLSSCRHGTLHRHDPKQLPLQQSSPGEDPSKKVHTRLHPKEGLADQIRHHLQSNITLRVYKRICKSSPSLTPFSLRNHRGIQALSVRKEEERQ